MDSHIVHTLAQAYDANKDSSGIPNVSLLRWYGSEGVNLEEFFYLCIISET